MKKLILLTIFLNSVFGAFAQVNNDECSNATFLGAITEFCSEDGEYNNIGATLSAPPLPNLCGDMEHDVWFAFTVTAPGVLVQIFGKQAVTDNNFLAPHVVFYEGQCGALVDLACKQLTLGAEIAEITQTNLVIGQTYYIRVDGASEANFHICIRSFVPVPSPESDCSNAVVLCDKSPFIVENLSQVGQIEMLEAPCLPSESASAWYKWTCETAGTLTFTLTPNNPNAFDEDLDFAVYELPGGIDDCANKQWLRCMASGETQGASAAQNAPCFGPTGLDASSTDVSEVGGCDAGDDNFVAALDMEANKSYALVINNYSESGFGFDIEFGGSGTFQGPEVDFTFEAVDSFQCDKRITFTNTSSSATDQIVSWNWSFGLGVDTPTATGIGPHTVVYESFGPKTAVLTIESSRGCILTKIVDIFVNECCDDFTAIDVNITGTDPTCFDANNGQIIAVGSGGTPAFSGSINGEPGYQYSIDGVNFQPIDNFNDLGPGTYNVWIQDIKGCMDISNPITLVNPPEIVVDVGPDVTVDLGFTHQIMASYTPMMLNDSLVWCNDGRVINENNPSGFIDSCYNCLDPTIMPFGTNNYILKVFNEAGCRAQDDITITTNLIKPVYAPNAFTPNDDFNNSVFTLGFGPQIAEFALLLIFDRWGNMIYKGKGLPAHRSLGEVAIPAGAKKQDYGWDGEINGVPANPGVYTWMAKVRFIDEKPGGKLEIFSGDVTLIR